MIRAVCVECRESMCKVFNALKILPSQAMLLGNAYHFWNSQNLIYHYVRRALNAVRIPIVDYQPSQFPIRRSLYGLIMPYCCRNHTNAYHQMNIHTSLILVSTYTFRS